MSFNGKVFAVFLCYLFTQNRKENFFPRDVQSIFHDIHSLCERYSTVMHKMFYSLLLVLLALSIVFVLVFFLYDEENENEIFFM